MLALPVACLLGRPARAEGGSTAADASTGQKPRQHANLDDRVKALTRALDLDPTQQSEVRKLLQDQREEVRRVWGDATVPAPYRVSATQAISDRTADRIRALLSDEQKKKYKPPKPPHGSTPGSTGPSVEDWMNATKPK
jgi:hypothetical protein